MTLRALSPDQTIRLAVSDSDSAFVGALAERCERDGWRLHRLPGAASLDPQDLVGGKLNALLVDPSTLGERGWDSLRVVCETVPQLAVIVCTGHSSVAERVRWLRLGVDQWIAKPCDPEEVMARIEVVSRHRRPARSVNDSPRLSIGEIELLPAERQARVGGNFLFLTAREFDVLDLFVQEQGSVLSRDTIYQRAWGYTMPWGDRSVDVYVLKLRRKFRQHSPDWAYIHTYHRLGYRFEPQLIAPDPDHRPSWSIPSSPSGPRSTSSANSSESSAKNGRSGRPSESSRSVFM